LAGSWNTTLKKILKTFAAIVLLAVFTTGCAVNKATAKVDPSARLDMLKTLYVKQDPKDERGVGTLIVDKFKSLGYTVSTGKEAPQGMDAIVTYVDKWFWDITMYMIELTIVVREPSTDYPLASGYSLHTSLTRKSPPEMVEEVVSNIMKEGKVQK
jgi:hypothetical protein